MIANEPIDTRAIAIIGMACVFPKAANLESFWGNIQACVDAIDDPTEDWEADRYLDPDRHPNDRVSTARGGFLKELFRFDPTEFGIMPSSLDGGEPDHFLALKVARDALDDAGYLKGHDHTRTGIILGHSSYLHRGQANAIQHGVILDQTIELIGSLFPAVPPEALRRLRSELKDRLPPFNSDVAPGLVPNVMTGRIANRLDMQGPNYIVDAACASSLLAVRAAATELLSGDSDLMLAGGVNASLPPEVSVIFSQLGALSPSSRVRPFSAAADGTLMGEGLGVVVLKRLSDALANGDRIYAVLRGIGSSSDGRGQGLLAPRLEGELLSIQRAYEATGIDPQSIDLVEAHGTGIPLGDRTEIAALTQVFGARADGLPTIAIGSVKSQIAHCIPAAGIAGLIKTALSLYHRMLPPTLCDEVSTGIGLESSRFYVNTELRPWLHRSDRPRRAASESFGFGGINCHAVLEEAPRDAARGISEPLVGGPELLVFAAAGLPALMERLKALQGLLADRPDVKLRDLAYTAWRDAVAAAGEHRLALVASDTEDLRKKLEQSIKRLKDGTRDQLATRGGIFYCASGMTGRLAFLFPGEGSQYRGMLRSLLLRFSSVREWFDLWQGLYATRTGPTPREVLFPPPSGCDDATDAALDARLHEMDMGSEACFIAAQAISGLLASFGVEADMMLGHSTGESSSLVASGAIPWQSPADLTTLMDSLNQAYAAIHRAGKITTGMLLTVGAAPRSLVMQIVAESNGRIHLAMDNCDNQLVLFGEEVEVQAVSKRLEAEGALCSVLPFDRAYHTELFSEVSVAFRDYYDRIGLIEPRITLYSCASADRFPAETGAVRSLAAQQWSTRVRFTETIAKMYGDGARYFVEVGPSGNLTAFVDDILRGQEYVAIQTNTRARDDLTQFLFLLASLFAHGRRLSLDGLFEGRPVRVVSPEGTCGKAPSRAIKLLNTLPVLRLRPETIAELRSELSRGQDASDGPADPLHAGGAGMSPTPALGSAKLSRSDAVDGAMHHYLDVMQDFLRGQEALMSSIAGASIATDGTDWPFLDQILFKGVDRLECACRLATAEDRFLRHHVLSGPVSEFDETLHGLAVVPLTVSLEMMAEGAQLLAGDLELRVIEDVRGYRWLALDEEETVVVIRAERRHGDDGGIHASISEGDELVIEADYVFAPAAESSVTPVAPLGTTEPYRWDDDDLYAHGMFHGPLFQSVAHVRSWSPEGIDADLHPPRLDGFFVAGQEPRLVFNPVLLDAMGQLSAYWLSQAYGTDFNSFPSRIGRIQLVQPLPDPGAGFLARGRARSGDASGQFFRFDYDCVDRQGRVIVRASDWEDVFYTVPHRFYQVRWRPAEAWLGEPVEVAGIPSGDSILWRVAPLPGRLLTDSGGIFLRLLAHAVLGREELLEWRTLPEATGRRSEWLMGRIALKEAVRSWVLQRTGHSLYPADILIATDALGKPYACGDWESAVAEAPELSLTHVAGHCLAVVGAPGTALGIDMEWPGRLRDHGSVMESFTDDEQVFLGTVAEPEREALLLNLWCAKEAAGKCLGGGLRGEPRLFEVHLESAVSHIARVTCVGQELEVRLGQHQGAIVAVASTQQMS